MRPFKPSILALLALTQLPLAVMASEPLPVYRPPMSQDDAISVRSNRPIADIEVTPTSVRPPKKFTGPAEPVVVGSIDYLDGKALIYCQFSGPVDLESALSKSRLEVAGVDIPLRLATAADLATFHVLSPGLGFEAFHLVPIDGKPLPPNATGVFTMSAGVKASQSELVSTKADQRNVLTPNVNMELYYNADQVAIPGQGWQFQFSLPPLEANIANRKEHWYAIDTARFDSSMIDVVPPVDNLKIYSFDRGLVLTGDTKANTTYKVTFSGKLPGYGCVLGKDQTVKINVQDYITQILPPTIPGEIVAPDEKTGRYIYPIYTTGAKTLDIHFIQQNRFSKNGNDYHDLGKRSYEVPQTEVEGVQKTGIDLTDLVKKGIRNCTLYASIPNASQHTGNVAYYLQFSKLGVTAIRDDFGHMTLFATDGKTGAAESNISFSMLNQLPILSASGLLSWPHPIQSSLGNSKEDNLKITKGEDSALLTLPPLPFKFTGSGSEEAVYTNKLVALPIIHPPIIEGEETPITLHSKLPCTSNENDGTSWYWTLYPVTFTPPGWSAFHFGADLRPHSFCGEQRRISFLTSTSSQFDASGNASVKYKVTNIRAKQPVLVKIVMRNTFNQTGKSTIDVADIIHPAALTAGIKTHLVPKDQGYEIKIDSIACDIQGKVAKAALKINLYKRPDLYQDFDENTAQGIGSVTVNPSSEVMHSSLSVPTGEPTFLVASVADDQGRISRTTQFVPPECCFINWHNYGQKIHESKHMKVGLVSDKDNYKTGEQATIWITAPFQKSRGIYVIGSAKTSTAKILNLDSKSGILKIDISPEMTGPIQCLVKLYDAAANSTQGSSNKASAAIGTHTLNVGREKKYKVTIDSKADTFTPGKDETLVVTVRDESDNPVSGAKVILESGQAYRQSLIPDEPVQNYNSMLSVGMNETSLDGLSPETTAEAAKRRRNELHIGPINMCHLGSYSPLYTPWREAKSDPNGTRAEAATDKNGRASMSLTIPASIADGVAFLKASAKGSNDLILGSQSIYVACNKVDKHEVRNAIFRYAGDQCSKLTPEIKVPNLRSWSDALPLTPVKIHMTVASILSSLLGQAERLCQNEPDTLDNRSSRLITLNCLQRLLPPATTNKHNFADLLESDYKIAMDKNCEYFAGHSWIEDVRDSSDRPPFMKIHGLHAVSSKWNTASEVSTMLNGRFDIHSIENKPDFNLKTPTESAFDELTSYFVFALSNLPREGVPEEPNDYYRNQNLKRLTAPAYIKKLSVQSLSWLLLATHATPADKAIADLVKAELYSKADIMNFDCNDAEKFLLRDTPLIKQAVLLSALCTDKSQSVKAKADDLALSLFNAINDQKLCSDQEVAFITLGLTDYCKSISSAKSFAAEEINLQPAPAPATSVDKGISVSRVLMAASPGSNVYKSPDGAWHCKQGDRIKQVVTFAGSSPLDYVILRDYFAGGVEASETALAPASIYNKPDSRTSPVEVDNWCQYQKLEQNGLTAYGSDLDTRKFVYEYTLTATAPGTYFMPATEVSCPYNRRVFGTSGTDRLIIDP